MLPLGFTAPFGTTILGWISVGKIHRSAGKLYGLGLAVSDGLLFPLLALDVAIWLFVGNLWSANPPEVSHPVGRCLAEHEIIIPLFALLACGLVDFFIVRRVWRAVNKPVGGGTNALPVTEPAQKGWWPIGVTVGVHTVLSLAVIFILLLVVPRFVDTFKDFGASLPMFTQLIIGFARIAQMSGFLLVPVVIAVDVLLCLLAQRAGGRKLLVGWAALGAFGLAASTVVVAVSMFLPVSRLVEQVAGQQTKLGDIAGPSRSRFPKAAHISRSAGTVLVHHDGVDVHYVLYASNAVGSAVSDQYNAHSLAWMDHGSFKVTEQQTFGYHREATDPFHLELNGKEYDLREGRVLVLHDDGTVEQLKIFPPLAVAGSPDTLAKLFAAAREMNTEPVTLEKLRVQLDAAEAQLHDVLKTCAPTHPFVAEVRESIGTLKRKIGEQAGQLGGAASAAVTFGPVREREVVEAIDFDSGKVTNSLPESVTQSSDIAQNVMDVVSWLEREGMDGITEPSGSLKGVGLKAKAEDKTAWELFTPEQIFASLKDIKRETWQALDPNRKTDEARQTPATWVFETREGGRGVLQVLGQPEHGVNVRYKMTQTTCTVAEEDSILAEQPPVVVETLPVSGARDVAPGETEIRVRFSKPMSDGSWSWCSAGSNSLPEFVGEPHYDADSRACVLKAKLEAGRTYAFWLNSPTFKNFKDQAGHPSVPYLLIFQAKQK